jgi:hypothetical protein
MGAGQQHVLAVLLGDFADTRWLVAVVGEADRDQLRALARQLDPVLDVAPVSADHIPVPLLSGSDVPPVRT